MPNDSHCKGCRYHTPKSAAGTCNYCFVTGQSRGMPIKDCTLWAPTRDVSQRRYVISSANSAKIYFHNRYDAIRALYDDGYNDMQIARELRISKNSVVNWRKQNCLASNYLRQKEAETV